ncbi:MAG: beta-barrel fold lipoprotein [Sphingobacterium sp.]
MKSTPLFSALLICFFSLATVSCSSDDDVTEPDNSEGVRKDMSVKVSYSGDFDAGFFVLILSGVTAEGDSSSQLAQLIDERDDKPYGPVMLKSSESTKEETLKFHSKNKIDGIMVNGGVSGYDSKTDIEVNVKIYIEGELVDERTLTQSNSSSQVAYTIAVNDY